MYQVHNLHNIYIIYNIFVSFYFLKDIRIIFCLKGYPSNNISKYFWIFFQFRTLYYPYYIYILEINKIVFTFLYTGEFTKRVWEMLSELFVCRGIYRDRDREATSPEPFPWISLYKKAKGISEEEKKIRLKKKSSFLYLT